LAVFAIAFSVSSFAYADDGLSPATPSWYGWEFAAADAGGVALLVYARTTSTTPLAESWFYDHGQHYPVGSEFSTSAGAIGSGLYLVGGPAAHLANVQPLNAAVSLGVRIFIPILVVQFTEPLGGTIGFFVRDSHGQPAHCTSSESLCIDFEEGSHADQGSRIGADLGFFGGAIGAIAVDQILLSREPIDAHMKAKHRDAIDISPDVRLSKDLAFAGVGGRF
jgi:hypothetical protein